MEKTNQQSDKKLIMLQGLPRSGKTTWAKKQGFPIVCPDAIRLAKTGKRWWSPIEHEIWATALTMVRSLFLAGHETVILDSTGCTRKQRDYFKPPKDISWVRYLKTMFTSAESCIQRAIKTGQPDLIDVIKNQYKNFEYVEQEEQFIPWVCENISDSEPNRQYNLTDRQYDPTNYPENPFN